MLRRTAKLLLQAVLVFQFAIGMDPPVAQASVFPHQQEASGVGAEPCPHHIVLGLAHQALNSADAHNTAYYGRSHHAAPGGTHDCCRSAACQCHCAYIPAVGDAVVVTMAASPQPPPCARVTANATRPDDLFRPPIA